MSLPFIECHLVSVWNAGSWVMLAASQGFFCRCVCQPGAAHRGSYYILFFWANACLLFLPLTVTFCDLYSTWVFTFTSHSTVGLALKMNNFLLPLPNLLSHHSLTFIVSCCFPALLSYFLRTNLRSLKLCLLLLLSSRSSPLLSWSTPTPSLLTPVTAEWSYGAMCQAWPPVFLDGSWPSRAEPQASHDCLLSALQPSLPLVLY